MAVLSSPSRPPPGPQLVRGRALGCGHGQLLSHATLTSQGHRVPVVAESSKPQGGSWEGNSSLGPPLPQVEFYALRAEAYIQLCDFSSAAQNLRKAYHSQPENNNYLERLSPGALP